MTAPSPSPDLLRRLLDDHLPAYLRLPADFLVWTQVRGDCSLALHYTVETGTEETGHNGRVTALPTFSGLPLR